MCIRDRTTAYSGIRAEDEYPGAIQDKDDKAPLIDKEDELEDEEDQEPIPVYFYLVVVVGFIVKGLNETLPSLAMFYFCKDDLKEDPAKVGAVINLVRMIPWSIKPVYGLFTDAFPVMGKRRTPYIFVGLLISCLTWIMLGTVINSLALVAVCMFFNNLGNAFANVCMEAVTVECSTGMKFARAATLQSWMWGTNMVASIIGSIFGGYMLNAIGNRGMFLIAGCVPVIALVAIGFAFPLEQDSSMNHLSFKESCSEWSSQMKCAFRHRVTVRCLIFLLLYFSTPTVGDASNYFYTNELHLSSKVLSTVAVFGNVAGVVGICVYQKYLRGVPVRSMVLWGTILSTALALLGVLLYSRTNKKMGIPDDVFLITDSTTSVVISQAAVMPLFALAALLCPEKVEGTIFALFTATMNFGSLIGAELGALLTYLFGVEAHNFTYMWQLVLLASLMQLIPLAFLWLLPQGSASNIERPDDEYDDESESKQD
eukprot:TRINITY_DN29249_c0_g1_i1.p1 TRINITY_DN29249_c0_g1~~TRINITY_DN29249_c0_g1_i1.p1  ORF type:complete len:484 (+),score=114.78 TRINITY_DN29249_c0_g1_i1:194-1645(+)